MMDEEQTSEAYWRAVNMLQEVIDSGYRSGKEAVLVELEDDLSD